MTFRELRESGCFPSGEEEQAALNLLEGERKESGDLPRFARIALGLGAWLAGFFLTGAAFALFDLRDEKSAPGIGIPLILLGLLLIRLRRGVFLEQLALAISMAGHLLLFYGLHGLHRNEFVGPLIGAIVLCAPVYWFSRHPVQRYLSVLWVWFLWWGASMATALPQAWEVALVALGALAAVLVLLTGLVPGNLWRPCLAASATALAGTALWMDQARVWGEDGSGVPWFTGVIAALGISATLWYLARPERKAMRSFIPFPLVLLALGGIGAFGVQVGLGLLVLAHARKDRPLEIASIVALGVFLVSFYTNLGIPFSRKSVILLASGAALLVMARLQHRPRAGKEEAP